MQHKLMQPHDLLNPTTGHIVEAGYSNEYLLRYNKEALKVPAKAKEWEYYLALNEDFAVGVTLAGVGVGAMYTVHFMDFINNHYVCRSIMRAGDLNMPVSPDESASFNHPKGTCRYSKDTDKCIVEFHMDNFGQENMEISGKLCFETPKSDKMVLVVPYNDPQFFYYNYKVNCMPVSGTVDYLGKSYTFSYPKSQGTQDWGRGVWEPVNQWYWGSASGLLNGVPFGFNIGHGFGDTSNATENMIFYNGICHKLDAVTFRIPGDTIGDLSLLLTEEQYAQPWKFVSNDGRFDMDFYPVMDRTSGDQKGEYNSTQHQVFGRFSGEAVLDDGTRLTVKDFFGFAEKVGNDWRGLEPPQSR